MTRPGPSDDLRSSLGMMVAASGLTTLGSLPPFLLGAQAVWVREDLDVGLGVFGAGVSVFFASAALGSLVAGVLVDRLGRRAGLALAGAVVAGGGTVMATAVSGPASLLACMAGLGLGNACCQTAANLSMARALPPGRRGLGFGVKQSAVPLAIMLGGLAVPTVGGWLGWRSTFASTAVAGALVAVVALVRTGTPRGVRHADTTDQLDQPPWAPLVLAGFGIAFASAGANFLGAFIASWGYETGLTATTTGLLMAAGSAGSITARIVSGHLADRRHGGNLPVVAVQMYVGALCLVGIAAGTESAVLVLGFLAFAVGWSWPGLLLYAVARVGRDAPARASGVVQSGAFVGGALGPTILGATADAVGFRPAWFVAAGCFLVGGTFVLAARRGFRADLLARPPRTPLAGGRVAR